ncbi:hypothetical protein [Natronincola ferrireducens]|uniref:Uncharacterized protein n=1 Tax=Natronincola ferrireducens TaxID=393762 RepID=A0A1G9IF02_9FIRM|nr:hypothetical protein [Natronincola ferrireducens]SDL23767.1 hypothetical protein SAMN05660472_02851 [Natronincola ferrireducens]
MSSSWHKYRNLNSNTRAILLNKEKTTYNNSSARVVYPISIFMKLGHSSNNKYDGVETIKIYKQFCRDNGTVWFSTDSLSRGMAVKRRNEFIDAIKRNEVVEIYFAIGRNSGGSNEIEYKAKVLDIYTDAEGINSPEKQLTPLEWRENKNKIWIKISSLNICNYRKTKDFIVSSSNKILSDSIAKSQYNFGYIERI